MGMRRLRRGSAAAAVLTVSMMLATTSCEPLPCSPPFGAAQWEVGNFPPGDEWPQGGISRPAPSRVIPDTDGDGLRDTVEETQGTVIVRRASGDLTLAADVTVSIRSPQIGDADGDGRTDLLVNAEGYRWFVPGSTPDGTHDLRVVGFRTSLPDTVLYVGDVDGDGTDDVTTYPAGTGDNYIWWGSGEPVTGSGTGPYRGEPTLLPGFVVSPVTLSADAGGLVLVDSTQTAQLWTKGGGVQFTIANTGLGLSIYSLINEAKLVDGPGDDRWLVIAGYQRLGSQRFAWDLDDLCAGPPSPG